MVSVIDKDEEEAKKALKELGLTNINVAYEENSSKTPLSVIAILTDKSMSSALRISLRLILHRICKD